ncbi:ABC transporter ATP-binding protein [Chloroflexota bacterium]
MTATVVFDEVSKRYRLRAGQTSLREALSSVPGRLLGWRHRAVPGDSLWALKDVSFEVASGEVLGFVGPNGAGKTTALKLLSRVARPTSGRIMTAGRVSALIELGAGFHPDLTGRENVFLNGVILGLGRAEIARKLDSIISFAGLEEFIDTPVKRYSSGMYVRLGFAVAAHVEPEILLVDEVLAVGDHEFRVKCVDYFRELQAQGVTTVIVSHNRHLIENLCSRVIYLRRGQVGYDGDPTEAWDTYLAAASGGLGTVDGVGDRTDGSELAITGVQVLNARGDPSLYFSPGEPVRVCIEFEVHGHVEAPVFYARLYRDASFIHGTNTARLHVEGTYEPGDRGTAIIDYESLNLLEGSYELRLGVEKSFFSRSSYDRAPSIHFSVGGGLRYGVGLVYLEHTWRVEPG